MNSPSMMYDLGLIFRNGLLNSITLVLSQFIFKPHLLQYSWILLREFCRPEGVSESITMSSAKDKVLKLFPPSEIGSHEGSNSVWMSFMKRLNRSGLRLHPCLTPCVLLNGVEYLPFTLRVYVMSLYIDSKTLRMLPLIP